MPFDLNRTLKNIRGRFVNLFDGDTPPPTQPAPPPYIPNDTTEEGAPRGGFLPPQGEITDMSPEGAPRIVTPPELRLQPSPFAEAEAAPRGPIEPVTPVAWTQGGRRFTDPAQLDPQRSYIVTNSDGSVRSFAPLATAGPPVQPPKPPAFMTDEAIDRPTSAAPSLIDSEEELNTFRDNMDRARADILSGFSGFVRPGPLINGFFDEAITETDKRFIRNISNIKSSDKLFDTLVSSAFSAMEEQEPGSADLFVGVVQANRGKLPLQAQVAIDIALAKPDGANDVFVALSRLAAVNPNALPEEITNIMRGIGVIEDTPLGVPSTKDVAVGDEFGTWSFGLRASAPLTQTEVDQFVTRVTDQSIALGSDFILYPQLQALVASSIHIYDAANDAEVTSVSNLQNEIRRTPRTVNPVLLEMDPEDFAIIKYGYPEFRDVPIETLARAFMIAKEDFDPQGTFGASRVASTQDLVRANVADNATKHMLSLGFSPQQIDRLRYIFNNGVDRTMPVYAIEGVQQNDSIAKREAEARMWARDNDPNQMPTRFYGLSTNFYLSVGLDDPLRIADLQSFSPSEKGKQVAGALGTAVKSILKIPEGIMAVSDYGKKKKMERGFEDPSFDIVASFARDMQAFEREHDLSGPQALNETNRKFMGIVQSTDYDPMFAPNGPMRRRLAEIFEMTDESTRKMLYSQNFSLLTDYSLGPDGKIQMPKLQSFVEEVEYLRRTEPNITDSEVVQKALDNIRDFSDLYDSMIYDTLNLLDMPAFGFGPTYAGETARLIPTMARLARGGEKFISPESVALFGRKSPVRNLVNNVMETHSVVRADDITPEVRSLLEARYHENLDNLTKGLHPSVREDGTIVHVGANEVGFSEKTLDKIYGETALIEDLLLAEEGAEVIIHQPVFQPLGEARRALDTGSNSLWSEVKRRKEVEASVRLRTDSTKAFGEIITGADQPLVERLKTNLMKGRSTKAAIMSQAVQETNTAAEHLSVVLEARRGRAIGTSIVESTRDMLVEMRQAFKTDGGAAWARTMFGTAPTEDMWRTGHVMDAVPIEKLDVFSKDVKVAKDTDDYIKLSNEAIQGAKPSDIAKRKAHIFEDEAHYLAAVRDEVKGHIQNTIISKYGLDAGGRNLLLDAQQSINQFMSTVFLEHPLYMIRNLIGDTAVGAFQGKRVYGNRPTIRPVIPAAVTEGGGVREVGLQSVRQLTPVKRKGVLGIFQRNGIPFVTNPIPGVHWRELSSRLERQRYENLFEAAYSRYSALAREALVNNAGANPLLEGLRSNYPDLYEKFIKNLGSPQMDLDDYNAMAHMGRTVRPPISAREVAQRIGVSDKEIPEEAWARIERILNDGNQTPAMAKREIEEVRKEIVQHGRDSMAGFGMQPNDFDMFVDAYEQLYKHGLSTGLTPDDASYLAKIGLRHLSSAVPYVHKYSGQLVEFLDDPDLYRSAIFGLIDTNFDEAEDMIQANAGHGVQLSQYLLGQAGRDHMDAVGELLDMAEGIGDPVLTQRAKLARDRYNNLLMEINHRDSLRIATRATRSGQVTPAEVAKFLKKTPTQVTFLERRQNFEMVATGMLSTEGRSFSNSLDHVVAEYAAIFGIDAPMINRNSQLLRIVRKTVPDATVGDLAQAWERAVARGWVKLVPDEVASGVMRIERGKLNEAKLKADFDEFYKVLRPVSSAVAKKNLEDNELVIRSLSRWVEEKTDELFKEMVDVAKNSEEFGALPRPSDFPEVMGTDVEMMTTQALPPSIVGASPGGVFTIDPQRSKEITGRYLNWAENRINEYQADIAYSYNSVAERLGLPFMPSGHETQALTINKYAGHQAPTDFVQFVASQLPVHQLFDDLSGEVGQNVGKLYQENRRFEGAIYDEPLLAEGIDFNLDEVGEYVKDPSRLNETPDTLKGFTNPAFTRQAEWMPPEGVTLGKVIPAPVDGRKFLYSPPEGYRAVITSDELYGRAARKGRYALWVKADATEADIKKMVDKMFAAQESLKDATRNIKKSDEFVDVLAKWRETYPDKDMIPFIEGNSPYMTRIGSHNRVKMNPSGFYASPPHVTYGETNEIVAKELAPFWKKWTDGGDMAAREVVVNALRHRAAGWPLTGNQKRAKNYKSLQQIYERYLKAGVPEVISGGIELPPDVYNPVMSEMGRYRREFNRMRVHNRTAARAEADWVLHNYTNTYDFDYLLRFMGPWHIWPTRTISKMAVRLFENPQYLSAYSQYRNITEALNDDDTIPEWAKGWIPLGWARRPLSSVFNGVSAAELVMNPSSFLFYTNLLSDFSLGDVDRMNGLGRTLTRMSQMGVPINPLFQTAALFAGAYDTKAQEPGEFDTRVDRFGQLESGLLRGTKQIMGLADMVQLDEIADGWVPKDIATTRRDRTGIKSEYARLAMEAVSEGNFDRASALLQSAKKWALVQGEWEETWFTGAFSKGLREDGLYQEAKDGYYGREQSLKNATGMFGGQIRGFDVRREELDKFMDEWAQVDSRVYKTNAEKRRATTEFLDNHPFVKVVLLSSNKDSATKSIAAGDYYDWKRTNDAEVAKKLASVDITDERKRTEIFLDQVKAQEAKLNEIEENYGIKQDDFLKPGRPDPEDTNLFYWKVKEDIERVATQKIQEKLIVPTEEEQQLLDSQRMFEAAVKMLMGGRTLEMVQAVLDAYAAPTYLDMLRRYVKNELKRDNFILEDAQGRKTNAMDFDKWVQREKEIYSTMPAEVAKTLKQENSKHTPLLEAVDEAILDVVKKRSDEVWAIRRDKTLSPIEKRAREDALFKSYKTPTISDVAQAFDDRFGPSWFGQHDENILAVQAAIGKRLIGANDIADLAKYMDGSWTRRISQLEEQLNALETSDDPDVIEKITNRRGDFQAPNGQVIASREALERFKEAVASDELLDSMRKAGVEKPFLTPSEHRWYFEYFVNGGTDAYKLQLQIDALLDQDTKSSKNLAFDLIKKRDAILGLDKEEKPSTGGAPTGDGKAAPKGVASVGKDVTRTGTRYQVTYVSPGAALSPQGKLTRNFLVAKYFTGQFEKNAPGDWVFEHMARNGVAERDEIVDFFTSLYQATKGKIKITEAIGSVLFAIENEEVDEKTGERRVPTFQYIKGIEAVLSALYGVPTGTKGGVTISLIGPQKSPKEDTPRTALPSTRGVGGLPTWNEAVSHMTNIFHDKDFVIEVIRYFQNSDKYPLASKYQRMLHFMYRTFPVGTDLTYEKWVQAMKLMWQTSSITMPVATSTNPATAPGQFRREPRLARFRGAGL